MATAEQIVQGLVQRGVPEIAAIAITGNGVVESGLDFGINEKNPTVKGSRGGFGFMQWTGPRRRQFEAYAGSNKRPLADMDTQLDFLVRELNTTEKSARDKIYAAGSVEDAAKAVSEKFLRPGIPHLGKRVNAARKIAGGEPIEFTGDVSGGGGSDTVAGGAGDDGVVTRDRAAIEATYRAFLDGEMSAQERASYEDDVRSGRMPIPQGMSVGKPINASPAQISDVYESYTSGNMSDDQRADYEADVRAGVMGLPDTASVQFGQIMPVQQAAAPVTAQPIAEAPDSVSPDAPEERGFFDSAGRQLGLTARAAGQGVAGMVGVVQDPINVLISKALGLDVQPPLREQAGAEMTRAGVPSPETPTERIVGMGAEAMVGAGTGIAGALGAAKSAAPGVSQVVANSMAAAPAAQITGAAGGGLAQQGAEEAGAGPLVQTVAALTGGLVGSGVGSAATRSPSPVVTPSAAVESVDAPRTGITQEVAAPRVLGEAETNEMRKLIARAANNNTAARKRLAEMAKVDPEALAAAERLGIEVPVDVFATNSAVQQASGIVRAVRGSDASAEWEDAFISAQKRANDIIEGQGGTTDLASVADRVQADLTNSIDDLRTKGSAIFESIKKDIPTGTRVQPNASTKAVSDIIADLGGEESLPPIVRGLFKAVTSEQGMTYGRLMQERGQIGKAIAKSQGPYADADSFTLGKLYAALGEDQMNFIGAELGDAASVRLKNGNALWSSAKDLEGKLVAGFGKDQQGSIANTLRTAMTNASKGDSGRLNRILDVIPEGLQRESMLTALADMSQAKSGQGGFSFPQYAKLYRGLRNNSPIYKRVADSVGKDTADLMRDLYEVSIRVDRAAQNVPRTGLANQALIADGLVNNVLNSSVGKATRGAAAGVAGSAVGGPLLGSLAAVGAASGNVGKGRAQAVGALFRSAEFQKLAVDAARGTPPERSIARVANSPAFLRWAKSSGISDPQTWLRGALTPQQAVTLSNGEE